MGAPLSAWEDFKVFKPVKGGARLGNGGRRKESAGSSGGGGGIHPVVPVWSWKQPLVLPWVWGNFSGLVIPLMAPLPLGVSRLHRSSFGW